MKKDNVPRATECNAPAGPCLVQAPLWSLALNLAVLLQKRMLRPSGQMPSQVIYIEEFDGDSDITKWTHTSLQ